MQTLVSSFFVLCGLWVLEHRMALEGVEEKSHALT